MTHADRTEEQEQVRVTGCFPLGCVCESDWEQPAGRSGYYWFIYHWAITEDDPELQDCGLWAFLSSAAESSSYIFKCRLAACVFLPSSSILSMGERWDWWCPALYARRAPSRPSVVSLVHLWVLLWHLLAFSPVWECEWNLTSQTVHRLTWEPGAVSIRRQQHLPGDNETVITENNSRDSNRSLTVTFSCLLHGKKIISSSSLHLNNKSESRSRHFTKARWSHLHSSSVVVKTEINPEHKVWEWHTKPRHHYCWFSCFLSCVVLISITLSQNWKMWLWTHLNYDKIK